MLVIEKLRSFGLTSAETRIAERLVTGIVGRCVRSPIEDSFSDIDDKFGDATPLEPGTPIGTNIRSIIGDVTKDTAKANLLEKFCQALLDAATEPFVGNTVQPITPPQNWILLAVTMDGSKVADALKKAFGTTSLELYGTARATPLPPPTPTGPPHIIVGPYKGPG